MAKQQINIRASDLTIRQLEWLADRWGTSQTETLTVLIDRAYQQERRIMPLDIEAIKAKFARTPEQAAAEEAEEAQYQAWKAEQSAWETKCYNEKISMEEFNRVRDEIDIRYGRKPTSQMLAGN